jgi:hypothetical protein
VNHGHNGSLCGTTTVLRPLLACPGFDPAAAPALGSVSPLEFNNFNCSSVNFPFFTAFAISVKFAKEDMKNSSGIEQ